MSLLLLLCGACQEPEQRAVFSRVAEGNWEVYLRTETEPAVNVSRYPANERHPELSAQGELVFVSDRKGSFNLYLSDPRGNNLRPLSHSPFPDLSPRWNAAGSHLVFVSEREERNQNLFVIPVSGAGKVEALTRHPAADYEPAWHRDGERIVFVSERSGSPQVHQVSLTGGAPVALTDFDFPCTSPAYAPGGAELAFVARQDTGWFLGRATVTGSKLSPPVFTPLPEGFSWWGDLRWQEDKQLSLTAVKASGENLIYTGDFESLTPAETGAEYSLQ